VSTEPNDVESTFDVLRQSGLLDDEQLDSVANAKNRDPISTWGDLLGALRLEPDTFENAVALTVAALPNNEVTDESDGRYAALTELGAGGMGRVDLIEDRHLRRWVARKELRADNPAVVARFLREARVTAQLEHPGIVPVYELGKKPDGKLYYTMRRVRGRTLKDALADTASLEDRLALLGHFIDLCQAVGYAHSKGVVHRDLKPENVMLGSFGETLVVDWGLAKVGWEDDIVPDAGASTVIESGDQGLTRAGTVMGTPLYMSPEQANAVPVDSRSDVWSLGIVLFEILAGAPPFSGPTAVVIEQVQGGIAPKVVERAAKAPRELAAIVDKALSTNVDDRYDHAADLASEIEAWRNGAAVGAYKYGRLEQLQRAVARFRLVAVAMSVALISGIASTAFFVPRLVAERDEAHSAREQSDIARDQAEVRRREAERLKLEAIAAQDEAVVNALLTDLARADLLRSQGTHEFARDAAYDVIYRARRLIAPNDSQSSPDTSDKTVNDIACIEREASTLLAASFAGSDRESGYASPIAYLAWEFDAGEKGFTYEGSSSKWAWDDHLVLALTLQQIVRTQGIEPTVEALHRIQAEERWALDPNLPNYWLLAQNLIDLPARRDVHQLAERASDCVETPTYGVSGRSRRKTEAWVDFEPLDPLEAARLSEELDALSALYAEGSAWWSANEFDLAATDAAERTQAVR